MNDLKETYEQWHERMMRETEGMLMPEEVIMHLELDRLKHGDPPRPPAHSKEKP